MSEDTNDNRSLVTQTTDLDIQFIHRNIRDLSKTAEFSHMRELEELHNMAYLNLKRHMAEGKPLSEDPSLALETYKTLSSVVLQIVETKRRAADTLLKARTLIGPSHFRENNGLLEEESLSDEEMDAASVSEGGVFGNLIDDGDPKIAM